MSLIIYTALFGPQAKPLETPRWSDRAIPMLCFTDQNLHVPPWQMVKLPTEPDPFRGNRRLKLLSHLTVDSDWSLYLDSNYRLMADPRPLLKDGDFWLHRHHHCANILEEADAIVRFRKADPGLVASQVAHYRDLGFCTAGNPQKDHSANAVLLRRHTPQVIALNEAWWSELEKFSHRDQLSLNFCAWQAGFELHYWPWSMLTNPYFYYGRGRQRHV